jgi:uncharacterized protein YndB with AHSA1/START domain
VSHQIILHQTFQASAERVFDALGDQDNMASWLGGKITVPVRGEVGLVGTVRRIHLGPLFFDERILEAERPRYIAYQIVSEVAWLVRHHGELRIESIAPEQTRVTWRVLLELKTPLIGMLARATLSVVLAIGLKRLARKLRARSG